MLVVMLLLLLLWWLWWWWLLLFPAPGAFPNYPLATEPPALRPCVAGAGRRAGGGLVGGRLSRSRRVFEKDM